MTSAFQHDAVQIDAFQVGASQAAAGTDALTADNLFTGAPILGEPALGVVAPAQPAIGGAILAGGRVRKKIASLARWVRADDDDALKARLKKWDEIDAEIGTRWQRLATALGETHTWLGD